MMVRRSINSTKIWVFLVGLFSMTQVRVIGSIGISELAIVLVAPFFYVQDLRKIKQDGMLLLLNLTLLTSVSCCISCWLNDTSFAEGIRGFAAPVVMWAGIVVMHRLLRRDLSSLSWFVVGFTLSNIINVFVFQQSADISVNGGYDSVSADVIIAGPLFWLSRLKSLFLDVPIAAFYKFVPVSYCAFVPFVFVAVAFAISDSGRSMAMTFMMAAGMMLFGGKKISRMRNISKHFLVACIVGVIALVAFKQAYVYAAQKGFLTENAQRKYENQTREGSGFISLIMAGRAETFVGASAALRRPLFGYGPWPIDTDNICEDFLLKYGADEDITKYQRSLEYYARMGFSRRTSLIPCHSHIIGFWVWYGFVGAILWFYVLYVIYRHLKNNIAAVPRWFGYFSLFIPSSIWNIFFSPFGARMHTITFITALFIANAVRCGKIALPPDMMREVIKGKI